MIHDGWNALARGEWEEARNLLERAIRSEETAEGYEAAAWACWWMNDAAAVFTYREKAYHLFLQENNNTAASRMASWIGVDYLEFKGELAIASGWFQRAEKLLKGEKDSYELALITILKARLAYLVEKDADLALKLTEESLRISRAVKSTEGEMIAEALKGFLLVTRGNISEGMPLLDDAVLLALSAETSDVNMIVNTCCFLIDACHRVRDYERAGEWCIKVKEICRKWRYRAMFASCRTQYASVLILRGNWKEAEEELTAAAGELKQFRPLQVSSGLVRLADLRRKQGRWVEAEKLLDEVKSHSMKPVVNGWLAYDKGDYDTALNTAERLLRKIPAGEKTERIEGLELIIRSFVKTGRMEEAEKSLNELEEIEKTIGTLPIKAALLSARGIYNCAAGKYRDAAADLEDAVDLYDQIVSPFESAQTRIILAEVLITMGESSRAEEELAAAKKIFRDLGAEKNLSKAGLMLKNISSGATLEVEAAGNIVFTRREKDVLGMIAEGESNKKIAEKLFLSVRTIEKHISNIYQKLGIKGKSARAYAASWAVKNQK
jgi:LuxR family transcriptional regulator, maltose regulon positive regulatory protein